MEAKVHDMNPDPRRDVAREELSALLDGELDDPAAGRVARSLAQDPSARGVWSEYCLIGDALRGELQVQRKLVNGLRAALDDEPTVLAPLPASARTRPAVWLAAAAAVGGISWALWDAVPQDPGAVPMARLESPAAIPQELVTPYLAAHQDYAQAVISPPEMRFTPVTLSRQEPAR